MENIEYRKGAVDAPVCISEGWNFLKSNYGLFIGMIVVQIIIAIAVSFVPYLGAFINVIVGGALLCGIYMALLAQRRGDAVPFSLMFEGFSRVVPVTLVRLVSAIPLFLFGLAIASFITLPHLAPDGSNVAEFIAAILSPAYFVPLITSYLIVLLISAVFGILLFFAIPLIAERDASVGDALRLSFGAALNNVGGLILLFLLEGLMAFAGALACGIGILFVLPIIFAANIAAYKRVFPDEAPRFDQAPPRPDAYGGTYGTPQN